MNDFHRSNKVSGIHWLKHFIEDLIIRIKLKPLDGMITLPRFEDYIFETNTDSLNLEQDIKEYIFTWQQKMFSKWEAKHYGEILNCNTDKEIKYHEMLKNTDYESSKVFTYIHDDFYMPLPDNLNKNETSVLNLNTCIGRLNMQEAVERVVGGDLSQTISKTNLLRSEENLVTEQWTAMHIIYDNSDYDEESNIIVKREIILLSIYHNITHNYIIISPDNNNILLNPYLVENEVGLPLNHQYEVDVGFKDGGDNEELITLLSKLYKRWEKKHKSLINFVMPPLDRRKCYVNLEILSAVGFEMDNTYIEYTIKIPESIHCEDPVHGRTHVSKALRDESSEIWNYGHIIELNLEMDVGKETPIIKVFFEVISTDWWSRHRTEGYGYLALSLQPGLYEKQLSCSRPEEKDQVEADSRRFFVGGCHLIKDLDVLAEPQTVDANFTYKTTGTINLRWNIISQSPIPGRVSFPVQPGPSSVSSLLLGAEEALHKYRKARARLAAATKDLDVTYEDVK